MEFPAAKLRMLCERKARCVVYTLSLLIRLVKFHDEAKFRNLCRGSWGRRFALRNWLTIVHSQCLKHAQVHVTKFQHKNKKHTHAVSLASSRGCFTVTATKTAWFSRRHGRITGAETFQKRTPKRGVGKHCWGRKAAADCMRIAMEAFRIVLLENEVMEKGCF